MKKTIAFLTAIFSTSICASVAQAGTGTSTHTGDVAGTCTLTVTDGVLPTDQGLGSSITTPSTTRGKISTVCNTAASTLKVELDSSVSSHPIQANYSEKFRLTNGNGAYSLGLPNGFNTLAYNKTNLSNGFSSVPSTIEVVARAEVPTSQVLAAGIYTVGIKATVTP